MGTLATILGGSGAVLLLVGLVGGGFEFSGSVMPRVGNVSRVLCFGFGGLLVLTAVGLVAADIEMTPPDRPPQTQAGPAPAQAAVQPAGTGPAPGSGYVVAGTGAVAYVFELPNSSAAVLTQVPDGARVSIVCTAQGESVTSPVTGISSSLWNFTTDGGFVPDVMVETGTDQPTAPNCLG